MSILGAIPTALLLQPTRTGMAESQKRLNEAQAEAQSGRHADVGLALGKATGTTIGLRLRLDAIEQTLGDTELARIKSETVQQALTGLSGLADRFRSTLTGARTTDTGRSVAAVFSQTSLDALQDAMSLTYDGHYLFGGLATDTPPLRPYASGPRQDVTTAFVAAFGFPPDDPAAEGITGAQLESFLDGAFDALFTAPGWNGTWSSAADETPVYRLPGGIGLNLSTTANASFTRSLAKAFSMIELLAESRVGAAAFEVATDKALSLVSEAQFQIAGDQARIGIGQARLREARDSFTQTKTVISAAVTSLEGVDPYEAATRVNILMSQLEGAYALTGRISRMSLLSYI